MKRGPKEWRPLPPGERILQDLKRIAPYLAFHVSFKEDREFEWDGDGPDPKEEGFKAYDVTVSAAVIVKGELIQSEDTLGGHYDKPGELDMDVSGYLNQMLTNALEHLFDLPPDHREQIKAALNYLNEVGRKRYFHERRQREAGGQS